MVRDGTAVRQSLLTRRPVRRPILGSRREATGDADMTRKTIVFPALVGALLTVAASPVSAAAFCANRNEMVKSLSDKFKENPAALGQINGSAVIEVFVSEKGSWTILATGTDGKSCVISAGEGWEINMAALGEGT
jgi:hypothetical protein